MLRFGPQELRLFQEESIASIGDTSLWLGFIVFVFAMLALDLGVFQRRAHQPATREALAWSSLWIGLALLFNAGIYYWFGAQSALEFFTGYTVEKALSVDNLFVFLVVFRYFSVPPALQHRVLFWGILGALLLRGFFIALGAALLENFHWTIYVLGGLLFLTGVRLFLHRNRPFEPTQNPIFRLVARFVPTVKDHRSAAFTVMESGRRHATPLLLALVAVETADVVFALDSIPAIFAITPDPFLVFTSNIFAMLGLRSLYFLLAGMMERFHYLGAGLAVVLCFVGLKVLLSGMYAVPIAWSLAVISLLIGGSIVLSMRQSRGRPDALMLRPGVPHLSKQKLKDRIQIL